MNVLDINTPLPELLGAMETNPDDFYEDGELTYELFNIEPALRFVLSYWASPRALCPWHIASLAFQLSEANLHPYEDEAEDILLKHLGAMKVELEALYKRDKAAKELAFV